LLGEKAKINANKVLIKFKNAISFKKMAKVTSLNELIISTADGGEDSSVFIGEKGKFSGQNISVASNDEIILKKKNSFDGSSTIFVDSSNCNFSADVSFMTPTPQGRCIGPVNPNLVPVANAGSDKFLILGEPIQLDGSRSYDEDGDRLVFEWTIVSAPIGSNPVLEGAQSPFPKFTSDINGTYELSLRVNDGRVFSTPSTVLISNINVKPEILFLTDQLVSVGNTVLLDGSNTIDLDDDSLSFEWTLISKPVGSTSNIIDSSQDIAQIFIDVEGDYEFSLRVFDGELYSKIKTLVISTQSIRPRADINGPSIISKNQVGVFDGSNSLNPNGGTLSYKWSLVYQEPGSIVNFLAGTSNLTTFEANISGFYVVQLIVDDGIKISKPKTFFIKIQNQKPIISYSFAQERTVMTGTTHSFDLSESFDPDNDSLSYNWTINSKPNGSTTSFSDSSSSNPNITVDLSGQYEVSVEISDGEDSVVEYFTLFANLPPLADFLISTGNFVGKSFNLDGSSSSDPDGDEIAFNWELLSTPTDSLANISISSLSSISILADKPGNYQVQLTVTDGLNESLPVVKT
ncbi:MAG: PKD domain-containing protein, partial [Halobacteriovoraceae bacterium]|nr:PKD domain-containing protein [Halobacteriovoraceae bacterium]